MELERLFGKYQRTIDEKGRLLIPSKLMKDIKGVKMYLKKERGLFYLIPEKYYARKFFPYFSRLSLNDSKRKDFFSSLYKLEIKSQNRIIIPKEILKEIGVNGDKKITLSGIGNGIALEF